MPYRFKKWTGVAGTNSFLAAAVNTMANYPAELSVKASAPNYGSRDEYVPAYPAPAPPAAEPMRFSLTDVGMQV